MKIIYIILAVSSFLSIPVVHAATDNVGGGQVNFYGKVTDTSCKISVDGQGSDAHVYLSPVTINEVKSTTANTYLRAKPFTIDVSHCQAVHTDNEGFIGSDKINVSWVGGNILTGAVGASEGYLANLDSQGAKNIQLVLAANSDTKLKDKIIPGDPTQKRVAGKTGAVNEGVRFTYYIGYATPTPDIVKAGAVNSYATYEITYL